MGQTAVSENYQCHNNVSLILCSELKRRLKVEQKAKEKIEKAATVIENKTSEKESKPKEEEISPNEFFKLRSAAVAALKATGNPEDHPYPHKFKVDISLTEFIAKYSDLSDGQMLEDVTLSVAGRVHAIRESGAKLAFYDLRGEGVKIQVRYNKLLISSL